MCVLVRVCGVIGDKWGYSVRVHMQWDGTAGRCGKCTYVCYMYNSKACSQHQFQENCSIHAVPYTVHHIQIICIQYSIRLCNHRYGYKVQ